MGPTAPGRGSRRDGAHLLEEQEEHSGGMGATASQIAWGGESTTPGRVSRRDGATVPQEEFPGVWTHLQGDHPGGATVLGWSR